MSSENEQPANDAQHAEAEAVERRSATEVVIGLAPAAAQRLVLASTTGRTDRRSRNPRRSNFLPASRGIKPLPRGALGPD